MYRSHMVTPKCGICKGAHWVKACPQSNANQLAALVDTGELCTLKLTPGRVGLDVIYDGSTHIALNEAIRNLLKAERYTWRPSVKAWVHVCCPDDSTFLELVTASVVDVKCANSEDTPLQICVYDGLGVAARVADCLRAAGFTRYDKEWRGIVDDMPALRCAMDKGKQLYNTLDVSMAERDAIARDLEAERVACEFFSNVTQWMHQRDHARSLYVGMPSE